MEQATLPPFKSSPVQAIQAVVSSANWVGNLLWLSLAVLASSIFVGQIAIFGYGVELLERRAGRPENPSEDIDSERIGDYITKGIWPFLVHMVVQLIVSIVVMIPIFIIMGGTMAVGSAIGGEEGMALSSIASLPLIVVISVLANVLTVPFLIRAMICQDFMKSLDLGWALGFVRLMFWEVVISGLIFGILGFAVVLAGLAVFCVGYIPAVGLLMGGAMNLCAQWYEIYLSRGGVPAPWPDDDVVEATAV